jgi:hypothetical protein
MVPGDANHAREVAQQELGRVKGGYEEERRRREQELRERHQVKTLFTHTCVHATAFEGRSFGAHE